MDVDGTVSAAAVRRVRMAARETRREREEGDCGSIVRDVFVFVFAIVFVRRGIGVCWILWRLRFVIGIVSVERSSPRFHKRTAGYPKQLNIRRGESSPLSRSSQAGIEASAAIADAQWLSQVQGFFLFRDGFCRGVLGTSEGGAQCCRNFLEDVSSLEGS